MLSRRTAMRKTLMIIFSLLVFALPLSAFSINSLNTTQQVDVSRIIRKNQSIWKKQIQNVDIINSEEFDDNNSFVATSLDQLRNHSKSVIKGTIYKLDKMNSPKNVAYTKASVHIDQVISGDKTLKNKTVYMALVGGLVSLDSLHNSDHSGDFNHDVLVKNDQAPLPNIGSKIITGLVPNVIDEPSEYNDALRQSGFTIHNSYAVDNQQYNLWIKKSHSQKFVLNNPKVKKQSFEKKLQSLTTEINKKYNH